MGFCGKMTVKFEGNLIINNLLGLLFEYGACAGMGIKTALGMGALKMKFLLSLNIFQWLNGVA